MLTKESLEKSLTEAMRNKDELRKRTFRMLLSAIKLAEVEKRGPLDEGGLLVVLQREVKTRQEAIADADKAGRPELAEDSQAELELLKTFLPKPLEPAEVETIIRAAISEAGATSPADMGRVMKLVTPQTQGRADNREISQLVRKLLGG
jgi:uncharacterized protein YqeY